MVRLIAVVALLFLAQSTFADDPLEPADYYKLLTDSKLKYNILAEPSKSPIEEMTCPRRDLTMRVVVKDDEKSLVAWIVKPEAVKLLQEGEEHYEAKRMDQAAEKYKAAIAADPQAVTAYFFYGDTFLFGSRDAAAALEQYKKGIALDPTMPSGHFFASTAYIRLGRLAEAREALVKALTFYPGYEAIWRVGTQNPAAYAIRPMVRHPFEPPNGYLGKKSANGIDVFGGADGEWLGYAICKAAWANEPKFADRHQQDKGWSIEEEHACVLNQVLTTLNMTGARLEEQRKAPVPENEVIAALPPRERHILEVSQAQLLDGYILFEIIGQRCPLAMSLTAEPALQELEKYIRKYVLVASE